MAKGQKKSTREVRKPKQDKAKPAAPQRSFLHPTSASAKSPSPSGKGGGG